MVKIFKKILLQNQKSYDLETWHVALGTQVLQSYINDDPGLKLTYFTARSNFVTWAVENCGFSETIAACDLKIGRCRYLIELKVCEY